MKRIAIAVALCCAILAFACAPALATGVHLSPVEKQVLKLVNKQRAAHHLSPLCAQANLVRAARRHTRSMASTPFFSHVSPNGRTPGQRAMAAGYGTRGFHRWSLGEAIAWGTGGYATPAQIVHDWMKSPPHRAILLGHFRDAGIGIAVGTFESSGMRLDDVSYFTLDVGKRTR